MPPVIDAHTHYYPPDLHADPRGWATAHGEVYWGDLVAPETGKTIQGFVDPDTMLRDMDDAGVDQAVLLGWYWQRPETCDWQNDVYARLVRQHPDRFIAFAAAHASGGPGAVLDSLKRCRDAGFQGVGELLPQIQGYTTGEEGFAALLDFTARHRWPINLHVTEPVGHLYNGRVDVPLQPLLHLAGDHPQNIFIFAHWGGLFPFYELNPQVKRPLANVFYDTAASPLLYEDKIFRLVLDAIGPDRVLWGSDYPLRLFPRRQKHPDFARFLNRVRDLDLDPVNLEKLLGRNAETLLFPEKENPAPLPVPG